MGKKKCAMFGRSQVKIPFSAYELNIALHNNNVGINICAAHLRKHYITFHSTSIKQLLLSSLSWRQSTSHGAAAVSEVVRCGGYCLPSPRRASESGQPGQEKGCGPLLPSGLPPLRPAPACVPLPAARHGYARRKDNTRIFQMQ